ELGVAAATEAGDERWLSIMLTQLSFAYRQQENWPLALDVLGRASSIGGPEAMQSAVEATGLVQRERGDIVAARATLPKNLQLATDIGVARRLDLARFHLATVLDADAAVP